MAVVVRPEDVDAFVSECNKENIDAVVVVIVIEKPNLVMHWNGETIVDLERMLCSISLRLRSRRS